jgi:nitroreductase
MSASHILEFMHKRRSVMARHMLVPGPDAAALEQILTIAARVPDHGKLAPWRFVVVQGDDRATLGAVTQAAFVAGNGDAETSLQEAAAQQFLRAPCVIAVLACPVAHPKIPRSEQILSAGAVCMNLLMAAQAMGFAAQWLTGAAAYEPAVLARLGGQEGDEIAGFMYLGTAAEAPSERPRPALDEIVHFGLPEVAG